MKVKLLKKIRKRFSYYWNKEGFPVVVDHYTKKVTIFDVDECKNFFKYTDDDVKNKVKIEVDEWAMRIMKNYIGKYYNVNFVEHLWYRIAIERCRIKNWKIEDAKSSSNNS